MVIILDEIREMIGMQGGDPSTINDISEGLVTLKRLMKEKQAPKKAETKSVEKEVAAPTVEDSEEEYVPRKTRKK